MAGGEVVHLIWTDIDPAEEDAFNVWYTNEHMPDRVLGIPGFLRGRRFRATSGGPKYLAYYEMQNRDVLWSDAYVAMRAEPDPKSRHFVARFRNTLRSTSTAEVEIDRGQGRYLGIAGVSPGTAGASLDRAAIEEAFGSGVNRIRLSRTDPDLIQGNVERMAGHTRSALRPLDRIPEWVLTVEGDDAEAVSQALEYLTEEFGPGAQRDGFAIMELMSECAPGRDEAIAAERARPTT